MNDTGLARLENIGSVTIVAPAVWMMNVECPTKVTVAQPCGSNRSGGRGCTGTEDGQGARGSASIFGTAENGRPLRGPGLKNRSPSK
jgi:hypothetical protein